MKRNLSQPFPPIFLFSAAYCAGIIIAYSHNLSVLILVAAILFSLLFWAIFSLVQVEPLRPASNICTCLLCPLLIFLLLGMFFTAIKTNVLEESLLKKLVARHECLDIYGTVVGEPESSADYVSFTFRPECAKLTGKSLVISEFTKVILRKGENTRLFPLLGGEKVAILSVVPLRPSSENLKKSLYNQEIQTLIMTDASQLKLVRNASFLPRLLSCIRKAVGNRVFAFLGPKEAGLLLGILLGDKEHISSLSQTNFAQAGVSHIVAVSGLHVGMMALICLWLARLLKLRIWQKYAITMGFVIFYALITGCRPSVLRASLVIGLGILGWLLGKEKHLVALLSASALVLLIYNPFFLFDVAFQLSFAAAFSIAIVAPILQSQFSQFQISANRFFQLFLVSIAAQAGIMPIAMYHFTELSLISAVANVFIVPLMVPILGLGLFGSGLSFLSSFLAYPVFKILGVLLSSVLKLVSFFANLSFSSFPAAISLRALFFYYLVFFTLVVLVRRRKSALSPKTLLFVSLIVPVGLVWWQALISVAPQEFTATFFDVGQGDSAVIRTPSGASVLIDGGQDPYAAKSQLFSKGICKIDVLILSHPHADHLNGLLEAVERNSIGLVLVGRFTDDSARYREFQTAICERQIPCRVAEEGMKLRVGSDLELVVLSDPDVASCNSGTNNSSVVVKVKYKDLSLLFPGDIEEQKELELVDWKKELRSSILKVSHHGSFTGANRTFLGYVQPRVAIVSVGRNNRFGHPSPSTIDALRSLGAKIYRTDRDGSVTITSDGHEFAVRSAK